MIVSAGVFWCPGCACRRLFLVHPEAAEGDPQPDIECEVCYYVWRKARRELPPPCPGAAARVVSVNLISEADRASAKARFLDELKLYGVAGGARLENWTHGRP